jgi:ABC-type glycerol-3-phosphate transport system substrate-binding protein
MRVLKLRQGVALAGMLMLAACGGTGSGSGNGSESVVAASPEAAAKVSAYTEPITP